MAKKYPQHSTFAYCGNNPINTIDAFGDSLAVLNLGGTIGHSALLIQDDSGRWRYYSMNGDNIYNCKLVRGASGGKGYHDKGNRSFGSVQSFLDSDYNREGSKSEIKNDDVNNYGFPEAYVLPTTPQQDEKARDSFKEETEKRYDLLFHNCATVAGNAIIAAGVSTGRKTSLTNFSNERNRHPIMPQALFNSVQKNNPSGHLVTRKQQ